MASPSRRNDHGELMETSGDQGLFFSRAGTLLGLFGAWAKFSPVILLLVPVGSFLNGTAGGSVKACALNVAKPRESEGRCSAQMFSNGMLYKPFPPSVYKHT